MTRTLGDSLDYDVENVFLNVNEFAVEVTIARGISRTTSVPAMVYTVVDTTGEDEIIETIAEERTYKIRPADYMVNGTPVTPRDGDRIITGSGVKELTFEVLPVPGRQCFELDAAGLMLSVHTKRVGS